jgi:hypothetical protein
MSVLCHVSYTEYSRLVVAHKYSGSVPERIFPTHPTLLLHAPSDPERHTRRVPHAPLECPRNGPLDQAAVPHYPQGYCHERTVQSAAEHECEGSECEGVVLHELCGSSRQHHGHESHAYYEYGGCHGEVEEQEHREGCRRGREM